MNLKQQILGLSLFFILPIASHAAITFKINPGHCGSLAGSWHGTGAVDSVGCHYKGTGSIRGANNFDVNLKLERTKFSLVCPKNLDQTLKGTCDDATGDVTISNEHVDLTGDVQGSGSNLSMDLSGEIDAEIFKAKMTADLEKN